MRPKQLLQRVVGARQIRHTITVEQAEAVAGRYLHEVIDSTSQRASLVAPPGPGGEQALVAEALVAEALVAEALVAEALVAEALVADLHTDRVPPGLVGKDMSGGMEPAVGTANVRPKRPGSLQTALDKSADPQQRLA